MTESNLLSCFSCALKLLKIRKALLSLVLPVCLTMVQGGEGGLAEICGEPRPGGVIEAALGFVHHTQELNQT